MQPKRWKLKEEQQIIRNHVQDRGIETETYFDKFGLIFGRTEVLKTS